MNPYYTHKEVCPGLFHIWEPAGVACTLIAGNTASLLIDTGYGFGNLAAYVKTLTNAPLQLINTHGHLDHAGGNWQFTQAAWLHPFEKLVYDIYQDDKITHVPYVEKKYTSGKISNPFPPEFNKISYMEHKSVIFQDVSDHQIFDLGGRKVEVLFLPGHTKGSLALFDHQCKVLMTGDNVGPSLWIMFQQSAPISTFARRLAEIQSDYPIEHVLASHNPNLYSPAIIDHVLHAVTTCSPETSSIFVHPRHGYKALHHKEPVEDISGLKTIHVVFPLQK